MNEQGWIFKWLGDKTPSTAIRRVIEVIDSSPEFAATASAQELAKAAEVNVATVTRCAQFLGFEGWPTFSKEIKRNFYNQLSAERMFSRGVDIPKGMFFEEAIRDVRALEGTDFSDLNRQVELAAQRFEQSQHIAVLATGTFLGPATSLAYGAEMMGLHIDLLDGPSSSVANKVRSFTSQDTLVVIDIFRTARIVEQAALSSSKYKYNVIAFCDRPTRINTAADIALQLPTEASRFLPSLTPLTVACQAILAAYGARNPTAAQNGLDAYSDTMETWDLLS